MMTLSAALSLSACANNAIEEYEACVAEHKVVKTDESGVVQFGKNGEPRWVSLAGSCEAEAERWNEYEDLRAKRRKERAWAKQCGDLVLVCNDTMEACMRHPQSCRCSCMNQSNVWELLRF